MNRKLVAKELLKIAKGLIMAIAPKGELVDLSELVKNEKDEKKRVEILTKELEKIRDYNATQADSPEKVKHVKFNYVKKDGTKRPVTMKPVTIDKGMVKGVDWDRTEREELEHHQWRTYILTNIS